jgi:hypothetical protein
MGKEKMNSPEWESFKEIILDLYVDKDMSLSEVMTTMEAQGFSKR